MEALLFIGIPATGKSRFFSERFANTHVRINLDMLKTRYREDLLLRACIEGKTPFVADNTNVTRSERARYIVPAKRAGFRIAGYFFQSHLEDALTRNAERVAPARIPEPGIRSKSRSLELPAIEEGFDSLHFVQMDGKGGFTVEDWRHEI